MGRQEYRVIEISDLDKFTAEVNKHLEQSWELHGDLIALLDPKAYGTNDAIIYIQAIKRVTA
jgi:hypothetical protein